MAPELQDKIRSLLQEVEKPGRYVGGELNSVHKDPTQVKLRVALIFPDAYEMGESHVGLKILYKILNDLPYVWAERVYTPWPDMEAALLRHQVPLFSLESKTPLDQFDLIGITLPFELVYTNILTVLARGGIPLWQKDRDKKHPIILGGGSCSYNPEPVADFFDAFVVGDGEDVILKIVETLAEYKDSDLSRRDFLRHLSRHSGVYVPSFFSVTYKEDGTLASVTPEFSDYIGIKKAIVTNLDQAAYPTAPVLPNIEVIHDRVGVEVQRGCVRACRFCQAGYIDRPERQRSPDTVKAIIEESLKNTGHEQVSLLSLSVGDYACLSPLLSELFDRYEKDRISISLPATRTETLTPDIIRQIKRVRKTGFTLAPEAGTPRMRRLINKGNAREDLMATVENVFKEGWKLVKFYYMCGLPMELESDLLGIAEEAKQAREIGRQYTSRPEINVSVSSFVPKPFTPFQWEPQPSIAEVQAKHELIRKNLGVQGVRFKHHHVEMSYLEGVFSRGDRRLARAVYRAWELGCRFDEWEEEIDFAKWQEAFRDSDLDSDFYVTRRRSRDEILPWDHLFTQMKKDFLWEEWMAAHDLAFIEDCSTDRCSDCGVCDFRQVKNVNYGFGAESHADQKEVHAFSTRKRILKDQSKQILKTPSSQPVAYTSPDSVMKMRVQFKKLGDAAFLGHLDLVTVFRRAFARAKIPVGFSHGFHPSMKVSFGPAQPVGQESLAEFMDIELIEVLTVEDLQHRINEVLPSGLAISAAWLVERNQASISQSLSAQAYKIHLSEQLQSELATLGLEERVQRLINASEWLIERRRSQQTKTVDIRPYIKDLEVVAPNQLHLVTHFGHNQSGIRPAEVLQALFQESPQVWVKSQVCKVAATLQ